MARNLFICLLLIFQLSSKSALAGDNVFTVEKLKIYSEGLDYKAAKQIALTKGQKDSLEKLLFKITPYNLHWKLKVLDEDLDAANMILGYDILDTYITSDSYSADVDFHFNKDKVNSLLNSIGITYAANYSRPTLIIPILHKKDTARSLWDNNLWNKIWSKDVFNYGLMKFAIALGDLNDLLVVNPENAMHMPYDKFSNLMKKYKVDDIVVLLAEESTTESNLTIRFLGKHHDYKKYLLYPKKPQEDDSAFYQRLLNDFIKKIDAQWKGEDLFQNSKVKKDRLHIYIKNMHEWNRIKDKITTIGSIQTVYIIKMNYRNIVIDVLYSGEQDNLISQLENKGLQIKRDGDKIILLYGR